MPHFDLQVALALGLIVAACALIGKRPVRHLLRRIKRLMNVLSVFDALKNVYASAEAITATPQFAAFVASVKALVAALEGASPAPTPTPAPAGPTPGQGA